MVTVELVFGFLIVSIMMAVFGWGILLFGVQVGCIDTAREVARQAARGDDDAVHTAESEAPQGAKVTVTSKGDQIGVEVTVRSKPFDFVPAITLTADATALREPGEQG
jgi:hypothetical protein